MGESEKNALWYGEKACNTIMRKYEAAKITACRQISLPSGSVSVRYV